DGLHDGEGLRLRGLVDGGLDGGLPAPVLHEQEHAQQRGADEDGGEVVENGSHGAVELQGYGQGREKAKSTAGVVFEEGRSAVEGVPGRRDDLGEGAGHGRPPEVAVDLLDYVDRHLLGQRRGVARRGGRGGVGEDVADAVGDGEADVAAGLVVPLHRHRRRDPVEVVDVVGGGVLVLVRVVAGAEAAGGREDGGVHREAGEPDDALVEGEAGGRQEACVRQLGGGELDLAAHGADLGARARAVLVEREQR